MGLGEKFFETIKEVLVLSEEVRGLTDEVKALSGDVRSIDRRLVRLETMVEMAGGQRPPGLPK